MYHPWDLMKVWDHHEFLSQMVAKSKGNPGLFQANLGWWDIIIWPDGLEAQILEMKRSSWDTQNEN